MLIMNGKAEPMRFLSTSLWFVVASLSDAGEPKTPSQTIAPYVDDQTMLVVRADVKRLDVETLIKRAEQVIGTNIGNADGRAKFDTARNKFIEAGGREVF